MLDSGSVYVRWVLVCLVLSSLSWSASEARQGDLAEQALPKIRLTMEHRHILKELIMKELSAGRGPADLRLEIGAPLPSGVSIQPFPNEVKAKVPQLKAHAFVVEGERIIVVNPTSGIIADIIE